MYIINNIEKLLKVSTNILHCIKKSYPNYYKEYKLRPLSFFMNEYYKNNENDWRNLINLNKINNEGYSVTNIKNNYIKEDINLECNIITWEPKARTLFHNHPNKYCIMMPINGDLKVDLYLNKINTDISNKTNISNNTNLKSEILKPGSTSYIDDMIGEHRVINNSNKYIVSIQLYKNII